LHPGRGRWGRSGRSKGEKKAWSRATQIQPYFNKNNYRELNVWRSSHVLAVAIDRETRSFPKDEAFALTSQMRKAGVSIPANIAEGCGRDGDAELRRFLTIALGSACELDYYVLLAGDLGYINRPASNRLGGEMLTVRRMLGSFIQKLKA
jgi:four helix bundle protein